MENLSTIKSEIFFGLKVSSFSKTELEKYIIDCFNIDDAVVFYGYSLGIIAYFKKYPEIFTYSNHFDLMVTDGRLFYLLAKYKGVSLKYDISIPQLVNKVLEIANIYSRSIMIIGSSEGNNYLASNNILKLYSNLKVTPGTVGGTFQDHEMEMICEHINFYKPDIILIGVSSPKKELFAYLYKKKIKTKIIIPCGVVVDILAGKVKHIPFIIKKLGLGAFWRLFQEPRRLFGRYRFLFYEITFKVIPIILLNKKNYFLPDIYKIKNR